MMYASGKLIHDKPTSQFQPLHLGLAFACCGITYLLIFDSFRESTITLVASTILYVLKGKRLSSDWILMASGAFYILDMLWVASPELLSVGVELWRVLMAGAVKVVPMLHLFAQSFHKHFDPSIGWRYYVRSASLIAVPWLLIAGAGLVQEYYKLVRSDEARRVPNKQERARRSR